jgi:hypothetical protein
VNVRTLTDADVAAIADEIERRQLLATTPAVRLLTAAEVAQRYGLSRDWVYAHADTLGAIRLGQSAKPRLRFDAKAVERALAAPAPTVASAKAGLVIRRRAKPAAELLPIRTTGLP